ncbi:hypothetical protein EN829_021530 [Mesorhizobium sp. M00.F.Ca.ET.186.01.1.1]|nr:hypothetical protein EN848_29560 [bacterium M00.F.Ca.ET.205.01.1.1]TGU50584.1 hypothetical protein EN795_23575 [bacterium M00.F.Ca.ET.152.01.1.1]TGV34042.1 hypothetical protein EN829_021530 [Mesorhizobium sp. M00.F.Ca.ET.186.01.1.1]TGZ40948.1 hypothetical protein EN805_22970 [bacterium M00.F.Ca.ET.162.01.1.1]
MNQPPLRLRYKALIAIFIAIGIAGILLRPIHPKSIFIAMFVQCACLTVFSGWVLLQTKLDPVRSGDGTRVIVTLSWIFGGLGIYGMYLPFDLSLGE